MGKSICEGCHRTLGQIEGWNFMTAEEREALMFTLIPHEKGVLKGGEGHEHGTHKKEHRLSDLLD